jgi:(E)-4-hydroxy-3-methylbut-2-enyl-diphosphate synthase
VEKYCYSLTTYKRFVTREVTIGSLKLGGLNPIRIQSMTTTDTMDTDATVAQAIRMIEAGCELVRITAPSIHEAKNLENIKKKLRQAGFTTPLVADIHFTPNAAELAARIVEKVRINPGNYADKKKFEYKEYDDASYQEELERIRERFVPLVRICKEYGTAMRIGTNHGSLSDRILSRYGDTPRGMVESAMEFIRICEDEKFYNLVISMKASNPKVMIAAYRLLVAEMIKNGQNYPLHLGVTEAGDGEDGRIKSAVGIGTLLEDGLGDTIRVSLTEEPEAEIPVAKKLAQRYDHIRKSPPLPEVPNPLPYSPYEFEKRKTREVIYLGGQHVPKVIMDYSEKTNLQPSHLFSAGLMYNQATDKWYLKDQCADVIYIGSQVLSFEIPGNLTVLCDYSVWLKNPSLPSHYPFIPSDVWTEQNFSIPDSAWLEVTTNIFSDKSVLSKLKNAGNVVCVISTSSDYPMMEARRICMELMHEKIDHPVVFRFTYSFDDEEKFLLYASTDAGGLFADGMGNGIWLKARVSREVILRTSFGILQACRERMSKTEYISCPSCGRTLFDLQETTRRIKEKTDHLKGIKIGIMGCIVNGPGEMADADYGYVGSGPGKITLYKGKEIVVRNVRTEDAVDALINLIKENGDWTEKPSDIQ